MGVTALQTAFSRLEHGLWHQRESLILWLPVAFGAGIAAWFALPGPVAWAGAMLLASGAAAFAALAGARARLLPRVVAVAAAAFALGCGTVWLKSALVAAPVLERPVVARFTATVERVELLAARGTVRLLLRPDPASRLPPRIRVTYPLTAPGDGAGSAAPHAAPGVEALVAGDRVGLRARLMPPPRAALPGGYDFARRAWFDRLGAVGSGLGPFTMAPRRSDQPGGGQGLRARLSAHIQSRVDGGAGAIAAAFAAGDRGGISAADDEAMRRAGLSHLLSISGLHVTAAVSGAMWLVLRLLALWPRLALRAPLVIVSAAGGALTGLGYTVLTGSEIPTVRSLLAALLVLLALVLGREAITLRLVAAGALLVLVVWPDALVGPSFQLSFAAVTVIVALHGHAGVQHLLARRDERLVLRLLRGLMGLLLTGLAVEFALMPIALFHFHKAGLYGAAANIVAIPLTTFVVMPAEALALVLDGAGLGAPAWAVVDAALSAMLAMAHAIGAAPGAVAALPTMPTSAFAAMVAGGLWLALWRGRVRWWGAAPALAGAAIALAVTPPDLLVTGDGRHVAVRQGDGRYALLRDRTGDFVRSQLGEAAGTADDLGRLSDQPGVQCSPDACMWTMTVGAAADAAIVEGADTDMGDAADAAMGMAAGGGTVGGAGGAIGEGARQPARQPTRQWTILAIRSGYRTDWQQLVAACAAADIVIADRWLPRACTPRWFKADGKALAQRGGLAIHLDPPQVESVGQSWTGKPWSHPPTIQPPRAISPHQN